MRENPARTCDAVFSGPCPVIAVTTNRDTGHIVFGLSALHYT